MLAGKGLQADSLQQNQQNKPVGCEDLFTNISQQSCRAVFWTKLLCQFLEILEGKSQ